MDRHRRATRLRWVREGQLLLSPQPLLLDEDGLTHRNSDSRTRADDYPDPVAAPVGSRRGSEYAGGESLRADQLRTGHSRGAHGVGCHGHGPRLRGARAMKWATSDQRGITAEPGVGRLT